MENLSQENSYRNILKRISAFGGVQLFNILVSLVRGKFVAMFLGPEGMGISSLYTSATGTIQQLSGLGLNAAFVKETASAREDSGQLPGVLAASIRLIVFTALLGGVASIFLSPLLSLWTFGTADYTIGFLLLSLSVSLSIAGAGYLSLLQGIGEVKRLAKATLVGGITGLCCGVPLYYFFGYDGIVPGIIILSAATFLFYFISFRQSVRVAHVSFKWAEHKPLVRRLLATGIVLMMGSVGGTFVSYLINAFVRMAGSVEDVGLFQAANSLTNQYVGLMFSVLALDYFPRLAAAKSDREKFNEIINRQIEIDSLIITPLLLLLMLTAPLIVRLFLTVDFLNVIPLIRWLGLGSMIQAVAFPLGYVLISQDNRRVYVWIEVVLSNLLWLLCSVFFYYQLGLIGLGVSLVVRSVIGDSVTFAVICKYYGFRLNRSNIWLILAMALTVSGGFISCYYPSVSDIVLVLLTVISLAFAFRRIKSKI